MKSNYYLVPGPEPPGGKKRQTIAKNKIITIKIRNTAATTTNTYILKHNNYKITHE